MLLVHQEGAVKVGEVVRYTLTYTPSHDPKPASELFVRIKNTTAIPYRAAYLVGPYTVHVSAYPSTFNPYKRLEDPHHDGFPQFEPNLKAGGHWHATLAIPNEISQSQPDKQDQSYTWIIEVSSQILFSSTASVHFELLVARDARSLDTGFAALASRGHGEPGKIGDLVPYTDDGPGPHPTPKGIYTKSVKLVAEDTAQLWNKPALPDVLKKNHASASSPSDSSEKASSATERKKKIHLVVLTHGLHSNVGTDMLYMKESIDATVKQAREDAKRRKSKTKDSSAKTASDQATSTAPLSGGQDELSEDQEDDPDDEQVIVRGFSGNVTKTERGIKYLGKRLAKYILTLTFPDQPLLPQAKSMTRSFSLAFTPSRHGSNAHENPSSPPSAKSTKSLPEPPHFNPEEPRPFEFTSISFIGHSLGGLIQLYAIGYIQKHSPEFFDRIKPVNFVTMAAPLLGLSNENPMYVKFALDFGLVGRTGQDLGLTWRAPTIARNGWNAMFSGLGSSEKEPAAKQEDPRAKPLLRILPSGPAHHVLKKFRNRTVYSNVVNDGIVPLRTSCLLFLDWRGLERVDNARRDNGLISTMAQFGWAELTGSNTVSYKPESRSGISLDSTNLDGEPEDGSNQPSSPDDSRRKVSAPARPEEPVTDPLPQGYFSHDAGPSTSLAAPAEQTYTQRSLSPSPFDRIFDFFRPKEPRKPSRQSTKALSRAQTVVAKGDSSNHVAQQQQQEQETPKKRRPLVSRGSSLKSNASHLGAQPPPKTSIFEAAGDIINPPIPTESWLTDPSTRSRTIFHDRIYYPEDIPPPPQKQSKTKLAKTSTESLTDPGSPQSRPEREGSIGSEIGSMKVEEKIARAYHRDLSWRKVLVRLEPDAHNNMIVRRMFANAYGWDVVRHLCDTHFADTYAARTDDKREGGKDRARPASEHVGQTGDTVKGQTAGEGVDKPSEPAQQREQGTGPDLAAPNWKGRARTVSEMREATDELKELGSITSGSTSRRYEHKDSVSTNDDIFGETDDEWESTEE